MKLQIVSMVCIVLTSIFIQLSDHYIEKQINLTMIKVLNMLQKQQFKTNHDIKHQMLTIYRALNITADGDIKVNAPKMMNKEIMKLRQQFENGEISAEEYTDILINHHKVQSEIFRKDYNEIWEDMQNTKATNWNFVKKICVVVQMIGVCSLVIGYINLISLIQNRVYYRK